MKADEFRKALSRLLDMPDECAAKGCENLYQSKTVLGIDIYRYSKYELLAQTVIPYIFRKMIYAVVDDLQRYEPAFFRDYTSKDFEKAFVGTGDGGYVILDTPLHGLLFAIYLASKMKIYNTGKLAPQEYKVTGEITYRYAMSLGGLYKLEDNWFGPAIITCSRILSVDKLNRFLFDENAKGWFEQNLNGIETILSLGLNNLRANSALKRFLTAKNAQTNKESIMIPQEGNDPSRLNSNILNVAISKIADMDIKNETISIYSVYLQVYIVYVTFKTVANPDKYVISIGNLNVAGLETNSR